MSDSLRIENLSRPIELEGGRSLTESVRSERFLGGETATAGELTKSFSQILKESVEQVNQNQTQADQAIKEFLAGRNKNIHETLLAVERADASLKLMMQVRNKILDAYREVMRMQV